jgi:hypothetical protein
MVLSCGDPVQPAAEADERAGGPEDVPDAVQQPPPAAQRLPWAETAGGDAQVIDLRPGPGQGRLGVAVHDAGGDFSDAWPSFTAYLHAVAEALHVGGGVGPWYPYLRVDDELWWDFAGESELNGEPLRPAPVGLPR